MIFNRRLYKIFSIALFSAAVLATYFPGLSGTLYYDDYANLQGLSSVHDFSTAWDFVTSGIAGPTGRPLAPATFLGHVTHWPDNVSSILLINVLLHLANALLFGLLAYTILKLQNKLTPERMFWASAFSRVAHPTG